MRRHLCVALALATASASLAHEGATGVVRERMEAMEAMGKALHAMTQHLRRKGDLTPIKAEAALIHRLSALTLDQFPAGTGKSPSEASARIWQRWADFEAKARALTAESAKLAEMEFRDSQSVGAQVRRVSNACSNCHELYRVRSHRH